MHRCSLEIAGPLAVVTLSIFLASSARALPEIRAAFFEAYPGAVGSRLDDLPSRSGHCGVCHFRFSGGGPRNDFGQDVEFALGLFPDTPEGRRDAILSVGGDDSDNDLFANLVEITDLENYTNTPTFPGLNSDNVAKVSQIDFDDILPYLTPEADEVTSAESGVITESWTRIKQLYR